MTARVPVTSSAIVFGEYERLQLCDEAYVSAGGLVDALLDARVVADAVSASIVDRCLTNLSQRRLLNIDEARDLMRNVVDALDRHTDPDPASSPHRLRLPFVRDRHRPSNQVRTRHR